MAALATPLQAQQAAHEDEEQIALLYGDQRSVSIATGSRQPIRRAPAVASVITAEDIAAMGATDLDEVLETVPGLHVGRAANSYNALFAIRGVYTQYTPQTLVLQNGLPTAVLFQGNKISLPLSYPVENIARIEVLRGPGSALYGADAYSGVINIITKTAADINGTQAGLRTGSFGTTQAWLLHGGKLGEADVAAYLDLGRSNGYRRTVEADAQTRNDSFFHTHASLAPGSIHTQGRHLQGQVDLEWRHWRLRVNLRLLDRYGEGAGVAQSLDPVARISFDRHSADLSWSDPQFTKDWSLSFGASHLYFGQRLPVPLLVFPPGTTFPTGSFPEGMIGAPETRERQLRLWGLATYAGFRGHRIRFGGGHEDLNLYHTHEVKNFGFTASGLPVPLPAVVDFSESAPFLMPNRRRIDYLHLQDEWQLAKDWTLTAGVRHDRYSDVGSTTNPRLALVWDARYDLTLKLLYGSAFRAPNYTEAGSINNPVSHGNPALAPETIRTLEAALAWQAGQGLELSANAFRYRMKHIIRAVPNATPGTGSTFQNTGDQHGRGIEVEASWEASAQLRLTANTAWQHAIDDATGQDAGYAPHREWYARADWRPGPGWMASAQLNRVADRRRVAGDNRPPVPDYTSVDLTLRSEHAMAGWNLALTLRNAFNADVREPSVAPGQIRNDLPMAPRAVFLQASHDL